MSAVDLNALRNTILRSQDEGGTHPQEANRKIVVNREGKVSLRSEADPKDVQNLTEVNQATFACDNRR
ncbi:hypothetical protein FACS189488_14420 [Betaproteobacteria bacterium]|nr:hypothetical protein FACS189488_14420 [Betaproteobacteria bacterium]